MARVLVTGMSGAGKSTQLDELARRARLTVDTDYDGWELPGALAAYVLHSLLAIAEASETGRTEDVTSTVDKPEPLSEGWDPVEPTL